MNHAAQLLRKWHRATQFRKHLVPKLVQSAYGQLLRTNLAEWRDSLTNDPRAGLRHMMAQAKEHHRRRVALPNAWLDWRADYEERTAANGVVAQFLRWILLRSVRWWHAQVVARQNANLPFVQAARQLDAYRMRTALKLWHASAARAATGA